MPIAMLMEWPGATLEDYDGVMKALDLDADVPVGGLFHAAGDDGGTLRIFDIWESEDAWNAFFGRRLSAALQQTGLAQKGQPNVRLYPIHNVYVPDAGAVSSLGSSAHASA